MQCEDLESEINSSNYFEEITMCKVVLDDAGLAQMKMEQNWISNIDILPFNTIFSKGKMLESWSGKGIERMKSKMGKYLS